MGRPRVRPPPRPSCGRQAPPQIGSADAPPNCSHPRFTQPYRGRQPPGLQGRVSAPETAAGRDRPSSVPPARPPISRAARPLFISPAPLLRVFVVAPEQLSRPPHPPRAPPSSEPPLSRPRARPSPQPPCGRQAPPADRLRCATPNCSSLSSPSLGADGNLLSKRPGGTRRRLRPASRPPFLRRAHPIPVARPLPFPPPSGPATCRGIPELSPTLRPGSCPPPPPTPPPPAPDPPDPVQTSFPWLPFYAGENQETHPANIEQTQARRAFARLKKRNWFRFSYLSRPRGGGRDG